MDVQDETPQEDAAEGGDETDDQQPQTNADAIEAINILPALLRSNPEWVKKITNRAAAAAKEDDDSREDLKKRWAKQNELFAGAKRLLGYPAAGATAPHIAMMAKAILNAWARLFDQVIPAKGNIVNGVQLGPNDLPRAQRVEKHMNWQLRYRIPGWITGQIFTMLAWMIFGSRFRYYAWNPLRKTHELTDLSADDVIISYTEKDETPLMENVERITVVRRMARWQMEKYQDAGFYSNLEEVFPDMKDGGQGEGGESGSTSAGDVTPSSNDDDSPIRMAADKIQGIEDQGRKTRYSKREIHEQHTYLEFPKSPEKASQEADVKGDGGIPIPGVAGETLPVIITYDKQTKKPLAITIRQEADPVDQQRFNQETQAFTQAMQNFQQQQASGMPPGIKGPTKPKPVMMRTIHRVIHYGMFPNPEGFYRHGIGTMLEGSNELANELATDFMLSAKFANLQSGFIARGAKAKRGDVQLSNGKFVETEFEPEQMKNAIVPIPFHPPEMALLQFVERLEANSELTASADVLSGAEGPANETAKANTTRQGNAMSLISVMARLYGEPLNAEFGLIAHGNSIYLDEVEYFPFQSLVPDENGQRQVSQEQVSRSDYQLDARLELASDARISSRPERVAEAQEMLNTILQSPLQENPQLVYYAFRKRFEAAEAWDYVAKMGPPPQPPPPPQPQSQETENAGFINEKDHPVLPDDNHVEHLHKINELKTSPLYEHLSTTGRQLVDRHERAHVAQFYLQLQQTQAQTGIPIHELAKQVGLGRVAPGPSNGGGAARPGGVAGLNGQPLAGPGGNPAVPG